VTIFFFLAMGLLLGSCAPTSSALPPFANPPASTPYGGEYANEILKLPVYPRSRTLDKREFANGNSRVRFRVGGVSVRMIYNFFTDQIEDAGWARNRLESEGQNRTWQGVYQRGIRLVRIRVQQEGNSDVYVLEVTFLQ
jgi:hypothetical protein